MSFLLDNLTAILVGATLLVGLVVVQQRTSQRAVDATMRHTVETQTASFLDTIQRDLENMQGTGATGWDSYIEFERSGEHTTELRFFSLADPDQAESSGLIAVAYRLEDLGQTVTVDGSARPAYRLARYTKVSGGAFEFSGASTDPALAFEVVAHLAEGGQHTSGWTNQEISHFSVSLRAARTATARRAGDQANPDPVLITEQTSSFRPLMGTATERSGGSVPSFTSDLPPLPTEGGEDEEGTGGGGGGDDDDSGGGGGGGGGGGDDDDGGDGGGPVFPPPPSGREI